MTTPGQTPRSNPLLLPYLCRLGSGARLVGRIGSGVHVSASFQKKNPHRVMFYDTNKGELRDTGKRLSGGLTSFH